MAEMIEVDPLLFVKCRLCLEELGMYQIVPAIQFQIKYCFDIDVEPYDGLPQLLCKKCENILSEIHVKKKTFVDKQETLKINIKMKKNNNIKSVDNIVSSSQQDVENEKDKVKTVDVTTSTTCTTTSKPEDIETTSYSPDTEIIKNNVISKDSSMAWANNFNKYYVCNICQKRCKKKSNIIRHFSSHTSLLRKYKEILDKTCVVHLEKVEKKNNMTGLENAVVLTDHKVIIHERHANWHILYEAKSNNGANSQNLFKRHTTYQRIHKRRLYSSSDDDDVVQNTLERKRIRLFSRSSNDTVVIDDKDVNNQHMNKTKEVDENIEKDLTKSNETECINIDDTSSDSMSSKTKCPNIETNSVLKSNASMVKCMQDLVLSCFGKSTKNLVPDGKKDSKETKDIQFKHKILSVGRKQIYKQGFVCTPLLRYLEYKDLEFCWMPIIHNNIGKESNCVRILTKSREIDGDKNTTGFKFVKDSLLEDELIPVRTNLSFENNVTLCMNQEKETRKASTINTPTSSNKEAESLKLYSELGDMDSLLRNKLLNASPVANPKQLKKKINVLESKANVQNEKILPNTNNEEQIFHRMDDILPNNDNDNITDEEVRLPVISSTQSLANIGSEKLIHSTEGNASNKEITNIGGLEKPVPRIKVKPVSELMPDCAVRNPVSMPGTAWHQNESPSFSKLPNNPMVENQGSTLKIIQVPSSQVSYIKSLPTISHVVNREYVILDTVEFPNTSTDSPLDYFRNLLQLHGIVLLETNTVLTRDFICLIKFKLIFNHENNKEPVTLCLALFCNKNNFCLMVKDGDQKEIDVKKISANWQWEILKTYKGNASNKVIANSQKISPEVFENTRTFVYLLKSINFKS